MIFILCYYKISCKVALVKKVYLRVKSSFIGNILILDIFYPTAKPVFIFI